jgi:ActR/RegA family two-component response regulator
LRPIPTGRILAGLRVLLVDDDSDFLESLDVALQARGAQVTRAESAGAGLAALDKSLPDVIVSDLGHLAKPMDPGLLVQAIADVMARRRG